MATARGEQAIGTLQVGEKVQAYNPQTKKMELEPILHVWINHDNDLEDLTLVSTTPAKNGKPAQQVYETIHTNKKHPFLTQEYGFLPVSALHVGMHIVRADGTVGEVFAWILVPGVSVMYNLEVQQDHTFTVGDGQWVVHNSGGCTGGFKNGITADEIRSINQSLGGSTELNGKAESVLASAERYDGFWNKAAVVARNIAGGHLFDDANKRTASAVIEELMKRNNIMTGVSSPAMKDVMLQVAKGNLRDIPSIASALRGF